MYSDFASLFVRLQFLKISLNSEVVEPDIAMDQINPVHSHGTSYRCFWTFEVWIDVYLLTK